MNRREFIAGMTASAAAPLAAPSLLQGPSTGLVVYGCSPAMMYDAAVFMEGLEQQIVHTSIYGNSLPFFDDPACDDAAAGVAT